jgi:hypothetical protein
MLIQRSCTPPCTADIRKALCNHNLIKYALRFSVKDDRRGKNLKIQMAQACHCGAIDMTGRKAQKCLGTKAVCPEGFRAQQQGGASCLRQTSPHEDSIV